MRLLVPFDLQKILLCIQTVSTLCAYRRAWVCVYLDFPDWSVVKNSSDVSKSELDETRKKNKKKVAKSKRERWLAPFVFS